MADRLDSEQIELLRAWGAGLATDERDEVRAAGKAITLLVDEIDRLNIDLWNLRAGEEPAPPAADTNSPRSAPRFATACGVARRGPSSRSSAQRIRRSAARAVSYSARACCTAARSESSATGTSHQLS